MSGRSRNARGEQCPHRALFHAASVTQSTPGHGPAAHPAYLPALIDWRKRSNFLTSAAETDLRAVSIASSKWERAILAHCSSTGRPAAASSMFCLMASLHARWQISVMSAPEKPSVRSAYSSRCTSSSSGDRRVHASKILTRHAWSGSGRVEHVRPVGGGDDEDRLLGADTVDLGQDLVDDPIAGLAPAGPTRPARLGDRVDLVKKQNARRGTTGLVEELPHVGLGLAEPHGEEFRALDRDEVRLDLVGDGLGHQRLAAAGRAVQQDALGGRQAVPGVLCRVLERVLERLGHLALHVPQPTDVVPRAVGDLDQLVAQARRAGPRQRVVQVCGGHDHRLQHVFLNVLGVHVDQPGLLAHALHGRLGHELGQVGARVAVRVFGQLLQVGIGRHAHFLGLGLQDGQTAGRVRRGEGKFPVETAEAAEGGIDVGRARRGGQHDDALVGLHAVQQGQKLRHNTLLQLALRLVALGRQRVQLVNEDDGRRVGLGLLKHLPQRGLGFTRPLRHDLRAVDRPKPHAGLGPDGRGDHCLAGTGRAVDDDSAGGADTEVVEDLGLLERQVDELLQLGQLLVKAADVAVAHRGVLHGLLFGQLVLGKYLRLLADHARRRLRGLVLGVDGHDLPAQHLSSCLLAHRHLQDVTGRHRPRHALEVGRKRLESVPVKPGQ
eukprot:scaffold6456_cov98-Isochrysis_galbana.AAC.4